MTSADQPPHGSPPDEQSRGGPPADGLHLASLDPARWAESIEIDRVVFAESIDPAVADAEHSILDDDRVLVAIDGDPATGAIVGTTGSYRFALTLPGGEAIDCAGVTNVGVLPTHRRRGIFRSLMVAQHDALAAEGLAVAVLNASDAAIYGRIGYGMASRFRWVRMRPAAPFTRPVSPRRLELLRSAAAREVLPPLYEAARLVRPGTLSRSDAWWDMFVGPTRMWKGGGHHEVVVAHGTDGDPGGYAMYTATADATGRLTVVVREVVAATDATHAALWRYLLDIDLADVVEATVPLDDPLLWLLADPRALGVRAERDFLFVRVLDTAAALAARRYRAEVDVVVDIADPFRPHGAAAGRFHLQGGPDSARCTPTDAPPAVAMDVSALGSLVLGGADAGVLAAAGWVTELHAGALAPVATAFGWSPAPFCATNF